MAKLKISQVQFTPVSPQEKSLIGFSSCLINDVLLLESIGIHTRKDRNGYRATFPARRLPNGKLQFFFRMVNEEGTKELLEAISKEIERLGLYSFSIEEEKDEEKSQN